MSTPSTTRPGLCSVTFRASAPEHVTALAAAAGLEVIEWGGDVHVPAGDLAAAARVARLSADSGIGICSYGSYFRGLPGQRFPPVLDAALALGADRIRVWAGDAGSDAMPASARTQVIDALTDAADLAAASGVRLALEYHADTLADGPAAVRDLLADSGHENLGTYWQPTVGAPDGVALAEYDAIADRVEAVHVFSWWPRDERLPLAARERLWRGLFERAASAVHPPRDALLEFVPDDDPAALATEAAHLRAYIAGLPPPAGDR